MKKLMLITLLLALFVMLSAEQYIVNSSQNGVNLVSSNSQQSVLEMTVGRFEREAVRINDVMYWSLNLKKEGISLEKGMPALPFISRSLIIPNNASMTVNLLASEYTDVPMLVAPSKGNLTRNINPVDVPYTFDSFYQGNGSYPAALSRLSEPFIIRDYRGITVHFQPFVYYPATRTLRVYTRIRLSVDNTGTNNLNSMSSVRVSQNTWFSGIYENLFLNYNQAKYPVLDEFGRILVITHSMFNTNIQPYVEWKRQKGYQVDVVDVAVAGPTATQIKAYIQSQYNLDNGLAFVQIVGDAAQVPTLTGGGGASDPSYALLAGTDSYPDIFVGRFSGTNANEIDTQVQRTVYYERDMPAGSTWLANGTGIASNQGGSGQGDMGESDQAHMDIIRTQLLANGYTGVDQIYEAQGATTTQISNALNPGRSYVNYTGHGSDTSWGTTGYSNTNVNQLTNDNKLPHIVSVACVNGNFTSMTCFAEAWMRAKNPTTNAPTGAIVFYGSSINQSWSPPMRAQDEIADLLTGNLKNTIGGLYYNGSSRMMEAYGVDGNNMYKTWHIFGDASLQVRSANPTPITVTHSPLMIGMSTFSVQTAPNVWVSLYANGTSYGSAVSEPDGLAVITIPNPPTQTMNIGITVTGYNKVTYTGTITVLPSGGAYVTVGNIAINDANNQADSGETVSFDLTLNNVGSDPADEITATITTEDAFLTITDNTAAFGTIPANGTSTSSNGFSMQISNNVSDQYISPIHVSIAVNGTVAWQYDMSIILNAPVLTAGAPQVIDNSGNNNGRVDAGELFTLRIPVTNEGHSDAANAQFSLLLSNDLNSIITPVINSFPLFAAGETASVEFEVVFSTQVPTGSMAEFTLMGAYGTYGLNYEFDTFIGIIMEDFESGDFDSYPWTFIGGNWTIDPSNPHTGINSAKSPDINDGGSTSMVVTMNIPETDSIYFWRQVSSEPNYDFLNFYINGVRKNQWSGTLSWGQVAYEVAPGATTFKWEYAKDYMITNGSDCAWVDDIQFPDPGNTSGTPTFICNETNMYFGTNQISDFSSIPLSIINDGTAIMIGTITGTEQLKVKLHNSDEYEQALGYHIGAGESLTYDVKIFPSQPGNFNADLTITSDDSAHAQTIIPVAAVVLPTSNNDNVLPTVTALKGNYPNPFNPETTIYFSTKHDSKVNVDIYNILGQKVKTLVNENKKAGNHSIVWNGKDDAGRNVGSGIYFYKMSSGNYTSSKKMILMK